MALDEGPRFRSGDPVVLRATLEHGQIIDQPKRDGGDYWYKVLCAKKVVWIPEEDLVPPSRDFESVESLAQAGRWGRLRAFRTALAIERITNRNRSTVYAFNAQRILFEPYQYKPLLKLLDSPDRRLLIADEVGLGKTIEAGLILAELEARQPLDKVLVVCPSNLRQKWAVEMEAKFGREFRIYSAPELRAYLARAAKRPEDARLRGIVSMQTLRNEVLRQELESNLPAVDLVIVDEAHHGRNPGSLTYGLLEDLGRVGQAMLLLTATPLHLGTTDLFSLLHSLRPTEFRDPNVLSKALNDHQGLFEAARMVRSQQQDLLPQCRDILRDLYHTGPRRKSPDPLGLQIIEELDSAPPKSRREWVDLERRIAALHPLSSVLTRTKKRDVQETAPIRKARVQLCRWTDEEDIAYQQLVGIAGSHGWTRQPLTLGQIQRARQAASSVHAAILSRSKIRTEDDEADEYTDIPPSEGASAGGIVEPEGLPALPAHDSKFECLMQIISEIWKNNSHEKVLIFTYFVGTAKYLADKLRGLGFGSLWISGEVPSDPHRPEKDERGRRVQLFRNEPTVTALVSTEVGSEGLDFQFCRHLVNYDLPWNPMVVEQRIGRIDRYGQKADCIYIHNLLVEDTVEERILLRLYDRIGLFERSIGDLEAILGEAVRELQRDFLNGVLTPEEAERRVEQVAKVIENRKIEFEKLERKAAELFGHEEFIREELKRVQRLGRYLTGESVRSLLDAYFDAFHPDVRIWEEESGILALRMSDSLARDVRDACSPGQFWAAPATDSVFRFTTDGSTAFNNEGVDLLNASHPLIQAAVRALQASMSSPSALIGQATLVLNHSGEAVPFPGLYYVVVFAHHLTGMRARRELEAIVWSTERNALLDSESAERLLHLTVRDGDEWMHEAPAPSVPPDVWERILSAALHSNRALRERERLENQATYARRMAALDDEHTHIISQIRARRETAAARERGPEILRLFDAQIARAESRYRQQRSELELGKNFTAELSLPIAACGVEVKRGKD